MNRFDKRTRIISKALTVILLLVSTSFPASAHDYWFEPETFFAARGANVAVRMNMGANLEIETERPLQILRTVAFQMYARSSVQNLIPVSRDGQMPVVVIAPPRAGNYLLAMERNPAFLQLEAAQFTDYLREENLDSIIRLRAETNESERTGRERYRRYLKTLLQIGDRHDSTFLRRIGHKLEIVPLQNPYRLRTGDTLAVRVFFDNRPLAGARVFALNRDERLEATTSADGTARFRLGRGGLWLVRLVHMRRCADDCAEVEWESFWGALTFGLR